MKKQIVTGEISDKRLLNIGEVCEYLGLGHVTARGLMDQIGATRHIGRRVLFDKATIDRAVDKGNLWGEAD